MYATLGELFDIRHSAREKMYYHVGRIPRAEWLKATDRSASQHAFGAYIHILHSEKSLTEQLLGVRENHSHAAMRPRGGESNQLHRYFFPRRMRAISHTWKDGLKPNSSE